MARRNKSSFKQPGLERRPGTVSWTFSTRSPEDRFSVRAHERAEDLVLMLNDMDQTLRSVAKYDPDPRKAETAQHRREALHKYLESRGIDLDYLMEG